MKSCKPAPVCHLQSSLLCCHQTYVSTKSRPHTGSLLLVLAGVMGLAEQANNKVSSDENGAESKTEVEELVPNWLWGGDDPANQTMPVKALTFTDVKTVVRIYGLGRAMAAVLAKADLHYWTSSGTTLGIVRYYSSS